MVAGLGMQLWCATTVVTGGWRLARVTSSVSRFAHVVPRRFQGVREHGGGALRQTSTAGSGTHVRRRDTVDSSAVTYSARTYTEDKTPKGRDATLSGTSFRRRRWVVVVVLRAESSGGGGTGQGCRHGGGSGSVSASRPSPRLRPSPQAEQRREQRDGRHGFAGRRRSARLEVAVTCGADVESDVPGDTRQHRATTSIMQAGQLGHLVRLGEHEAEFVLGAFETRDEVVPAVLLPATVTLERPAGDQRAWSSGRRRRGCGRRDLLLAAAARGPELQVAVAPASQHVPAPIGLPRGPSRSAQAIGERQRRARVRQR